MPYDLQTVIQQKTAKAVPKSARLAAVFPMRALRHLRFIVAALMLLLLVGMSGFHWIEGWSWFDGLYMVITTFTTIGYQEIHPLSHSGRIFNLALWWVSHWYFSASGRSPRLC